MTVHAAKGLEWPVVFLPRVSSSNFPSSRRNQGPETFLSPKEFDPATYAGGDDGERRLWYVAITRVTKFLNVSTLDRNRKRPSEYFKEIHHDIARRDGSDPTPRDKGTPRPPDDAVMLPTTFSDLTYWWRCPHEYQLRSLMGFGPGVGEQYGYGQQLHNILAEIHDQAGKGVIMTRQQVAELVEARFLLRYTQGPPLEALKRAAQRALSRYVEMNRDALANTFAIEKPFEFIDHHSGALITGVVDLLEKIEPSGENADPRRTAVGIVDFKAHRIPTTDAFHDVKQQAERQLQLYANAVRYAFPYQPAVATAQLVMPRPPAQDLIDAGVSERFTIDVTPERQEDALSKVRLAVGEIKDSLAQEEFKCLGPNTGWCPRCDFRKFCPGYARWRAIDRSTPSPPGPIAEAEAEVDSIAGDEDAGT